MAVSDDVLKFVVAGLGALGTGGIGKFIYDFMRARTGGRKSQAEGSVILVNSATKYAQGLVERLERVESEFATYRREQDRRNRKQDALFRAHARWDIQVAAKLEDLGEVVAAPPPLYSE